MQTKNIIGGLMVGIPLIGILVIIASFLGFWAALGGIVIAILIAASIVKGVTLIFS